MIDEFISLGFGRLKFDITVEDGVISHAYPCTASMDRDTELGDAILHQAGYVSREAVEEGLGDEMTD